MNSLRDRDTARERDLSGYEPRDYDRDSDRNSDRNSDRDSDRGSRVHDRVQDRVQDREISLGTGTILGIFFALALLCAVFFGFGYSMGRKSAQPTASIADATPATGLFGGTKPSPGSPLASSLKHEAPAAASAPGNDSDSEQTPDSPAQPLAEAPSPSRETALLARSPATASSEGPTPSVVVKPAAKSVPAPIPVPAAAPDSAMPQTNPNGTTMVQVAAVSHQEDADLLLSALKTRGYAVFARQEPQDRLLHIQVGPFLTRKDADAMRLRLLADGYKAIVK